LLWQRRFGLRAGLRASRVLILLNDGTPNITPDPTYGCDSDPNLWTNGGPPHDCGIYYAQKAAEAGVAIYSIGHEPRPRHPWLQEIARITRGQFYYATSPDDLDLVFDGILSTAAGLCSAFGLGMAADGAQPGCRDRSNMLRNSWAGVATPKSPPASDGGVCRSPGC